VGTLRCFIVGLSCAIVAFDRVIYQRRGERTPDAPSPYSARPARAGLLTGSPQFLRCCGYYAVAPAWEVPIARRCWKHSRQ
jgi:hypothetical protein